MFYICRAAKLRVKKGGDKQNSFVEEETDWSDWKTIKEYNISGTGGKEERTMQFTVPQEKGWEVFTEIDSEEIIIPRTIKVTKAPHTEKDDDDEEEKDEDEQKPIQKKITEKPPREEDEGPGKRIGEEVSIKLPKETRKSSNSNYFTSHFIHYFLSLKCVYNSKNNNNRIELDYKTCHSIVEQYI
ncbi:unnamed protein product [Schistosoma turkestanicum]|nr:unnamed protein product [Schistosoma turkestanicum]